MDYIAQKLHKDRDEILQFCHRHKRIRVFGAGMVGSMMLRYLMEEKIEIYDVLVSPGQVHKKEVHGLLVKTIEKDDWIDGDGVIVAVGNKFRQEVMQQLMEVGIKEEDFYLQRIYPSLFEEPLQKDSLLPESVKENKGFFAKYRQLDGLGKISGTDKCSNHHNYLNTYEFFFKEFKDKPIRVLELGVFNGASLQTWADYFTKAQIYGVDIEEACSSFCYERCQVILKDLSDEVQLRQLADLEPSIIVDDASHYTSHQIKALYNLFPSLKPGGIFIVEDLGTNFRLYRSQGYQDAIISCYDFCKAIADVVTSGEFLEVEKTPPACVLLKKEIEDLATQIEMISFIHESCIIIKK